MKLLKDNLISMIGFTTPILGGSIEKVDSLLQSIDGLLRTICLLVIPALVGVSAFILNLKKIKREKIEKEIREQLKKDSKN